MFQNTFLWGVTITRSQSDSSSDFSSHLQESMFRWCCTEHVETMVISFWVGNLANTWSFKKVSPDRSPRYLSMLVELDLYKFTKTTGTNTQSCTMFFFGIPKGFQHRVGLINEVIRSNPFEIKPYSIDTLSLWVKTATSSQQQPPLHKKSNFHDQGKECHKKVKFLYLLISYLQNLLFNCSFLGTWSTSHESKIPHQHFRRLCFTCTTLAAY